MPALTQQRTQSRLWEALGQGLSREIGIPLLVVSVVLFASAMVLLGANVSALRQNYAGVQHSNEELLQIATVNNDILRVEMVVRGYALSGDPIYLVWHKMSVEGLRQRIVTFDKLFLTDPGQMDHVRQLKVLLTQHIATFDRLMGMVPTDKEAVIREIVDFGKKVKRRPIEDLLRVMRTEEMRELESRQRDAERQVLEAYRSAIGISALALVFGALGFALLLHDHRAGRRQIR